jgi:hypothetical protein
MRKRTEDVQREASQAGLQTTGKWLSWLNNHIFNSDGVKDGILGNGHIYGTKAHCLTHESDWLGPPSLRLGKGNIDGPWVKEDATFLCGTKVPYWEDVMEWHHKAGMESAAYPCEGEVPRHAPRGYCKRCVKALKKRQRKSR